MDPIRIVTIVIALGLVIFVHELGHFLVARWCGVLVERFSIGFGPILFSWRRGETEYALSAIPLGGYVKMLGQTDTPEVEELTDDERSYQNKSVPKRMAIISAGVIMNIIFGFVCFVVAYWMGVPYQPSLVGETIANQPAWKAGIQAGDRITAVNGTPTIEFETLMTAVALTRPPHGHVELEIRRGEKDLKFDLVPVQDDRKPIVGIAPALGLELDSRMPARPNTPASQASNPGFEKRDTIVSVHGEPVQDHFEFAAAMFRRRAEPVTLGVRRKEAPEGRTSPEVQIQVAPNHARVLGLELQMGEIVGVQDSSPAAQATDPDGKPSPVLPKDVIVAVDGERDFDPMRLADLIADKAGEKVELTLLRPGPEQREVKLHVVPRFAPTWGGFFYGIILDDDRPASIPSLGIAYQVLPTVRCVIDSSPAAKSDPGPKPKDVIQKIRFHWEEDGTPRDREMVVKDESWPSVFWSLQFPGIKKVTLTVKRADAPQPIELTLTPEPDPTWPVPMRGLLFRYASAERKETSLADALSLGLRQTRDSVINLYKFLRGLIVATLSLLNLAGPLTIAQMAYSVASEGIALFILFIGSLSINLAVVNFLPIPILDGGHMVFLTYELFLRRKPTERMILAANYLGLAFILTLMLFVFGLDILRILGWGGV